MERIKRQEGRDIKSETLKKGDSPQDTEEWFALERRNDKYSTEIMEREEKEIKMP